MSIRFDNHGDRISRTTSLPSPAAGFSIGVWVYITTNTGALQDLWWLTDAGSAYMFFGTLGGLETYFEDSDGKSITGSALTIGTWNHIAFTFNTTGTVRTLYLNGVSQGTDSGPSSVTPTLLKMGNNGAASRHFDGRIAIYKEWSALLTAAEIQQEMRSYLPRRTANLSVWSPMLAGATERLADYSGNGRVWTETGTLTDEDGPPVSWGAQSLIVPYAAPTAASTGSLTATLGTATLSSTATMPHAIPFYFDNGVVTFQDTGRTTAALTPDGYTWAQGTPVVIDNFGGYIAQVQYYVGGSSIFNSFTVSSDQGATWSDPTISGFVFDDGEGFVTRAGLAYDSSSDKIHMLWLSPDPDDGIIYRRYSITRDGSNHVTAITRDAGVSLQMDSGAQDYQHTVLKWLPEGTYGRLVAIWGAISAGGAVEYRATQRLLSNTTADGTAGNWTRVRASASSEAFGTVTVEYSSVGNVASGGTQYVSANFSPDLTLFLLYATTSQWRVRAYSLSAAAQWDTLLFDSLVCAITRSGAAGGYLLKFQLGTDLRWRSSSAQMIFGISTRNSGADEWTIGTVNAAGTTSFGIAYSVANPEENSFVTGDVMVAEPSQHIIATYTDLPAKHTYARSFNGSLTPITDPFLIFDNAPTDIPTVYHELDDDRLLVLLRDFNAAAVDSPPVYTPPYDGWFVSVEYVVVPIVATLTATLLPVTLQSFSTTVITGALTWPLSPATLAATATLTVTATLSATLAAATVAATGTLTVTANVSTTLAASTLTSTATLALRGQAAITLSAATIVAAGTLIEGASGSVLATLGAATLSSLGTLVTMGASTGSVTATLTPATLTSLATLAIVASVTVTLRAATLSANESPLIFEVMTGTVYGPSSAVLIYGPSSTAELRS